MTAHLPTAAVALAFAIAIPTGGGAASWPPPTAATSARSAAPALPGPGTAPPSTAPPRWAGAGPQGTSPTTAARRWSPPVAPFRVTAPFAAPERRWLPGHRGIDLRARVGQPVGAAGDGRVAFVGPVAGRGVVSIDHGGLRTTYEPVDPGVHTGDVVRAGDRIGTVSTGTGHCGSGSCLHMGLRRGREYLDPLLLLGRASARLRPW